MQATNEELETLNEELQATVEELNTTNDELEARSSELEEANLQKQAQVERAEAQRMALSLALSSFAPDCAIVNGSGEIYHLSPAFSELPSANGDGWWQKATTVTLNGNKFRTKIGRLDGLYLVTFEALK